MSKKPSHLPLFPDAYHRDTTHLTTEEHGAYLLLLMAAWGQEDCSLPSDERRLAALVKLPLPRWRKIAPNILEFFTIDRGRLQQKRLRKEWDYVKNKSGKRKAAAEARWSAERDANAMQMDSKCNAHGMHLGGGGGVGVDKHYQDKRTEGDSAREELNRFPRVIDGGAK